MKKVALILMVLTIITKIFGFLRVVVLSNYYGTSNISDVYLIATTIPTVIFAFIGISITTAYIPLYTEILNRNDEDAADNFTRNISNILFLVSAVIVFLIFLFPEPLVKVFASGFAGETLYLAVQFTKITSISIVFLCLTYIFKGYLHIKNNFFVPALMLIPLNSLIMVTIGLSSKYGVGIIPIGYVMAVASQLLFVLPFVYRNGYRHSLVLQLNDSNVQKMMFLAIPVIIGVSVREINVIVDRTLASQIVDGGISALTYAHKLNDFIQGIFILSISTVVYPRMSKMAAVSNIVGIRSMVKKSIIATALFVIPASVGAIIFANPVIGLLYGRGEFDAQSMHLTSVSLVFYSIGMIGFGIRHILSKSYYALGDTKTPMRNSAIAMVLNIILNVILSRIMGLGGLALATSISALFCALLLTLDIQKKIGGLDLRNTAVSVGKILVAAFFMGFVAKISFHNFTESLGQNISLIIAIATGMVLYAVTIACSKIADVDAIIKLVKDRVAKA